MPYGPRLYFSMLKNSKNKITFSRLSQTKHYLQFFPLDFNRSFEAKICFFFLISKDCCFLRKTFVDCVRSNLICIESKMFARILRKPKKETSTLSSLDKLNETLEMLEKKESVLQKKGYAEVEKAKAYTKAKNKKAAIQCLKKKKLYEEQIGQLANFQLRIHDQMIMLEGAKATTETVDALRSGASAMKAMNKATNIDDLDKTMDEINEQTENMKQIQEALATPIGAAADFDEDELEAELEELEEAELEEQLLQPATTAPLSAPVKLPASRVSRIRTEDEDELAALQAEMAL